MNSPKESNSIDEAIAACEAQIAGHRKSAVGVLQTLFAGTALLVLSVSTFGWLLFQPLARLSEDKAVAALFSSPFIFAILVIFMIVFGVLMSVYRFHLNEVAKAEHYRLGFLRVRVAAHNVTAGYQSEVRQALTDQAFNHTTQNGIFKTKLVESPLPGHPTSDFAALLLDKILARFDIVEKKKDEK
ncbi:hypothetical protein [Roseateles sp.]|jgi:hypothetical protein|uniref:hypothetical protein n=1 Tax=Roseateles sp. TaxID=1971397 RepID=UPI0037C6AC42